MTEQDKQALIKHYCSRDCGEEFAKECAIMPCHEIELIQEFPTTEALTDKEQRIFLAAMEREEKVCEEVDGQCVREAYETSLVNICKEIKRKVKGALWT